MNNFKIHEPANDFRMPLNKILKRELEVAFSKHAQPIWFRVLKYVLLAAALFLFWGSSLLWIILLSFFIIAMFLHFWYRYKTKAWTQDYGMWKHENTNNQK